MSVRNFLVIITGPTSVGKTAVAVKIARLFQTEIISADSRQFYRGMEIGTAAPEPGYLQMVKHHFTGFLDPGEYFNAALFEQQALDLITQLFITKQTVVCAGGSGLYLDVLCNGIDDLPDPDPELRAAIDNLFSAGGIAALKERLLELDPEYYALVDLSNPARIKRGIEICLQTGRKYSDLRSGNRKKRDFGIIKIGLNLPREELFDRIKHRTRRMIEMGLVEEVKKLISFRDTTALNTVGYKEIFTYLDGLCTLQEAEEKIITNTRRYAKRQLTWFMRDPDIKWFHPDDIPGMEEYIRVKHNGSPAETSG